MRHFLGTRKGLVIAIVAAVTILGSAVQLMALPPNEVETIYLDENGNEVGYFFRSCNGDRIFEGTRTDIRLSWSDQCSHPQPALTCTYKGAEQPCSQVPFWDVCNRYFTFDMCQHN